MSQWYQDYDWSFDCGFTTMVLALLSVMVFVTFLFYHATTSTDEACKTRGMQAYESRGYFCVDAEGRLYKP
jgi:hypothetical protein